MHYLTNSRSIYLHAFHLTHLNQPLKYATLLHNIHIPNTQKSSHTPSTSTTKYTLSQRLVSHGTLFFALTNCYFTSFSS